MQTNPSNNLPPNDTGASGSSSRRGVGSPNKKKVPKKLQHIPSSCLDNIFTRLKQERSPRKSRKASAGDEPPQQTPSPTESASTSPSTLNSANVDGEPGFENGVDMGLRLQPGPDPNLQVDFSQYISALAAPSPAGVSYSYEISSSPTVEEYFPPSASFPAQSQMPRFIGNYQFPTNVPQQPYCSLANALGPPESYQFPTNQAPGHQSNE